MTKTLLFAIPIALMATACAFNDDAAEATADAGVDTGVDVASDVSGSDTPVCPLDPSADDDGDGLENQIEDRNLDCIVDEDETDPYLDDTDGDGLLDGIEDVDRDGVWDVELGELNPRSADTDADGIADAEEARAAVCTSDTVGTFAAQGWVPLGDQRALYVTGDTRVVAGLDSESAWLFSQSGLSWTGIQVQPRSEPERSLGSSDETLRMAAESAGLEAALMHRTRDAFNDTWRSWYTVSGSGEAMNRMMSTVAIGADFVEPMFDPTAESLSGLLRIEGIAGNDDVIAGISIGITAERDWIDGHGVANVSPPGNTRLRPFCQDLEDNPMEAVDVLLVLDTRPEAAHVRNAAIEAVDRMLRERRVASVATRVWVVTGDAHVYGAGGGLVTESPLESANAIQVALAEFPSPSADQRLWWNARLAVERLFVRDDAAPMLVVVAGSSEDTEFRLGEFEGRDGNPDDVPMSPDSDDRSTLTAYYADQVLAAGVDVVTVANGWTSGEQRCVVDPLGDPRAQSFEDIAVRSGGTFVSNCGGDFGDTLFDTLLQHVGIRRASLQYPAIPSAIQISDGGTTGLSHDVDVAGLSVVLRTEGPAAAGFLFWDAPNANSQRRR